MEGGEAFQLVQRAGGGKQDLAASALLEQLVPQIQAERVGLAV